MRRSTHPLLTAALLWAVFLSACATAPDPPDPPPPRPQACAERSILLERLAERYAEQPAALGLDSSGGIIELLTHADGRTWTLMLTLPNGLSCLIAAGEYWQNIPRIILNGATA